MPSEGPTLSLVAIAVFAASGVTLSALTAALGQIPRERLMALRDEGGVDGATAARLLDDERIVRSRLLSGRVLSIAGVSAFTAHVATRVVDDVLVLAFVGLVAFVYALLSEAAATLARRRANSIALKLLRWCRPLELALAPIAVPVLLVSRATEKLTSESPPVPSHIAEREVEHLIEQQEEQGALQEGEAELLRNVLEFKDTVAREVMVPRTQMIAIECGERVEDIVARVVAEGHSRYPVYRGRVDKIEGILYAKDLFQATQQGPITTVVPIIRRNVLFVPEAQKIGDLLKEMRTRHQHLAIVVDEFGGTSGIVTLEDILEEIVGEIQDEHDTEESLVTEIEPGRFIADARVSIHDLGEIIDVTLRPSEEGFDSLGGLVVESLGRVPAVGEQVIVDGLEITVREADAKKVQSVEIVRRPTSGERQSGEVETRTSDRPRASDRPSGDRPTSEAASNTSSEASSA